MTEFTQNELQMIADLLDQCADRLGNDGCNDSWLPDTDENWELIQQMQRRNSKDPRDWDTRKDVTNERGLFIPNFMTPAYFAHKIRELLKIREMNEPEIQGNANTTADQRGRRGRLR